jgi:hypothetical protein
MLRLAVLAGVVLAATAPWTSRRSQAVNPDAAVLEEFQTRLKAYVALHEKQEGTLPALPKDATAAHIDQHQRQLERLIVTARATARPGDVFGPGMAPVVKRLLIPVFSGTTGRQNRAVILDPDDQVPTVALKVNARYPDAVPLSTMPPAVLEALPDLGVSKAHEVKFYFIGRHLILLDVHAHLVVDFIENAMPPQ